MFAGDVTLFGFEDRTAVIEIHIHLGLVKNG